MLYAKFFFEYSAFSKVQTTNQTTVDFPLILIIFKEVSSFVTFFVSISQFVQDKQINNFLPIAMHVSWWFQPKDYLIGTIFRSRSFASATSPSQVSEKNFKKQFPSYKFKYIAKLIMLLLADRNRDSSIESIAIQVGLEIDETCKWGVSWIRYLGMFAKVDVAKFLLINAMFC